jgi:hypothetical protein
MVPQFGVAVAKPNADGFFEVELPDFTSDPIADDKKRWGGFTGEFRVVLRETKTWNPIASLRVELSDFRTPGGRLKIMAAYPSDLVFIGEIPDQGIAAAR